MSFKQIAALVCQIMFPVGIVLFFTFESEPEKTGTLIGIVLMIPIYIVNLVKVVIFTE